jgi:hypothetical protein
LPRHRRMITPRNQHFPSMRCVNLISIHHHPPNIPSGLSYTVGPVKFSCAAFGLLVDLLCGKLNPSIASQCPSANPTLVIVLFPFGPGCRSQKIFHREGAKDAK